jgi:hypothetical protein
VTLTGPFPGTQPRRGPDLDALLGRLPARSGSELAAQLGREPWS